MCIKTFRRRTTIGRGTIFLIVIFEIILSSFRVVAICQGEEGGRLTIFETACGGNKALLMLRDQASTTREVGVNQKNGSSNDDRIQSMEWKPSNDSHHSASSLEPVYLPGGNGLYPIDQINQENSFYNDYNQPNYYPQPNNYDNNFNNNPDGSIYAVIGPNGIVHKDEFGALEPATSFGGSHHHHHHGQRHRMIPTHQQSYDDGLPTTKNQFPDHLMTSDVNKQFHAHSNHQTRKSPERLGSVLDSGQVLLSKEISTSGQPKAATVEAISVNDLKTILKRLRPLDVQRDETYDDNGDNYDDDDDNEQEQEQDQGQNETDNKQTEIRDKPNNLEPVHRLQRTVPNSAFYEGSGKRGNYESSRITEQKQRPSSSGSDEDLKFLRNLVNIGEDRSPKSPVVYDELIERPDRANHQLVYVPGDRQALATKVEENEPSKLDQSIPIDKLVDHLMSNSRMATFGIQHNDANSPNGEDVNNNNDDANNGEEEDEEDDDGNLGGGDGGEDDDDDDSESQEADESALTATRVRMDGNQDGNNSSMMINDTTEWVPMNSSGLTRGDLRVDDKIERNGDIEERKQRKKKRKKRKRKKKGEPSVFGLVVGNRMLNKTEVFKLIRILNKMSNKSKSSKEREASRKLLKFLIKLVLEEYKKERKKNEKLASGKDKRIGKDPIRELLRSVLEGPVDMKNSTANDSSIELRPLPIAKIHKLETTTQKAGPDVPSKHMDQVDETNQDESLEKDNDKNPPPTRGLGELADDLEHYFDADFFEDLADNKANATKPPNSGEEDEKTSEETIKVSAAKRRRASRGGGGSYRLPVPIHGQVETDEDDEDTDPGLDKGKMARRRSQPARRRYLRKRRRPVGFRGRRKRNRRRGRPDAGRRRLQQTRTRMKEDPDEAEDPDEEPSGDYQPVAQYAPGEDRPPEDSGPLQDDGHEPEPSNRVVEGEEPPQRHGESQEVTARPEDESNQDYDDDEDDGKEVDQAPEERRLSDESVSSDIRVKVPPARFDAEPVDRRMREVKKRRKSRRRMMAESRYEIPAPIVAGQPPAVIYNPSTRSHGGRKAANITKIKDKDVVDPVHPNGADSMRLHNKKNRVGVDYRSTGRLTNRKVLPRSKMKKLQKLNATGKDLTVAGGGGINKTKKKTKKKKTRRDRSTKGIPTKKEEEKKVAQPIDPANKNRVGRPGGGGGESDSDYYNESSSYSELCDDDGKCKVKRTERGGSGAR